MLKFQTYTALIKNNNSLVYQLQNQIIKHLFEVKHVFNY